MTTPAVLAEPSPPRLRCRIRGTTLWTSVGPAALFGLQFLVLLALGVFVWHRLTLGQDFAAYAQAFSSIGTGHLNPTCTVCGYRYIDLHFELIMWPMSILYFVFRTTFVLVFIQALSLAVASAAAYFWIA